MTRKEVINKGKLLILPHSMIYGPKPIDLTEMYISDQIYAELTTRFDNIELITNDKSDCYFDYLTNEHHFKTWWHQQNTIPALKKLIGLPYVESDFFPIETTDQEHAISVTTLMPRKT